MTALCAIPFLLQSGCLWSGYPLGPKPVFPELDSKPVPELPSDFAESPTAGTHKPLEWWRAFADPVLNRVVDAVLASNFEVAEAVALVQQARAQAQVADAEIFPVIRARGDVDSSRVPVNAGLGSQLEDLGIGGLSTGGSDDFTLPDRLDLTTFSLGVDLSYELDFWGRVRHDRLSAGAELLASESDVHVVRLGILAETIRAYFDIVDRRRRVAIAHDTVDVLEERERVAETRYNRGLTDLLNLYRVRQDLRDTQAGLPQLDNALTEAKARLAVLLGGYREDVATLLANAPAPLPVADPVPAGIPADLLLQRPDVRAARHRLEAAGYHIKARRAELMPSVSFSGIIGLQTTDIGDLFDASQWFTNFVSNLLVPVFDGGRLASNVALAHARFNELAAAYGRTVVRAVNEVEAALAGLRNEGRRHALLSARLEEARASVDLRSQRYASGLGDYADFLDASRTRSNVESALASSERNLALGRLAVHRALGGAWTAPDTAAGEPALSASTPTEGPAER